LFRTIVVCKGAGSGVFKRCGFNDFIDKSGYPKYFIACSCKDLFGWDENTINIDEVAERLQDISVQFLTVHARTRTLMAKVHYGFCHMERIKGNPPITIPIFGNGGIVFNRLLPFYENQEVKNVFF
jgi:hypothetical protein